MRKDPADAYRRRTNSSVGPGPGLDGNSSGPRPACGIRCGDAGDFEVQGTVTGTREALPSRVRTASEDPARHCRVRDPGTLPALVYRREFLPTPKSRAPHRFSTDWHNFIGAGAGCPPWTCQFA